jgi:hypothetical protein
VIGTEEQGKPMSTRGKAFGVAKTRAEKVKRGYVDAVPRDEEVSIRCAAQKSRQDTGLEGDLRERALTQENE